MNNKTPFGKGWGFVVINNGYCEIFKTLLLLLLSLGGTILTTIVKGFHTMENGTMLKLLHFHRKL